VIIDSRARRLIIAAALCAPVLAIAQETTPQPGPTSRPAQRQQAPLPPLGAPAGSFGAGVTLGEATPLERIVADPKAVEGRELRVDARIVEVCTRKGCWMVVTDGERQVRVRFKDYGFFVPRDAGGRRVIVQGQAMVEEISEELARHHAEESGHPERAGEIHGPQTSITLVATGVEVLARDEAPLEAQGTPEVLAALDAKLRQAQRVAPGAGKVDTVEAAFRALRAAPGGRIAEVGLATSTAEWFAFSAPGGEPFARGWAVRRATGEVARFGEAR
jgi:hypothetical protein